MSSILYVVLWDNWAFETIHYTLKSAEKACRSMMHTIQVCEYKGEIINDEVYIIADDECDFVGVYTEKEAFERIKNFKDVRYVIRKVKVRNYE